jgi:hypothetical protein
MKYFFCLDLFIFLHVLDYLHVVGFSRRQSSIDGPEGVGAVF